jgi:hypothetical protein
VAEGTAFLLIMVLGHLSYCPPAGLATSPPVSPRRWSPSGSRGHWPPRRPVANAFGMTDPVVALTLGALTGFQLINVTLSGAPITASLALIPAAAVPRCSPCTGPCPRWWLRGHRGLATVPLAAARDRGEQNPAEIDAQGGGGLAGLDRRISCCQPAHGRRALPGGHPPARLYAGRGPGQRKETQ